MQKGGLTFRRVVHDAMTTPQAIIIGACIIGASVVLSELVSPYEMSSEGGTSWRVNTVTGAVKNCTTVIDVRHPDADNQCR